MGWGVETSPVPAKPADLHTRSARQDFVRASRHGTMCQALGKFPRQAGETGLRSQPWWRMRAMAGCHSCPPEGFRARLSAGNDAQRRLHADTISNRCRRSTERAHAPYPASVSKTPERRLLPARSCDLARAIFGSSGILTSFGTRTSVPVHLCSQPNLPVIQPIARIGTVGGIGASKASPRFDNCSSCRVVPHIAARCAHRINAFQRSYRR